jgi:hypothetical protein
MNKPPAGGLISMSVGRMGNSVRSTYYLPIVEPDEIAGTTKQE